MDNDDLFRLIQDRLDPEEVVDILGLGTGELCLRLRGAILEHREAFEAFLDIYDDKDNWTEHE